MNGGDDRNHGSAEVISSAMRDDESEDNDAEMLNDADDANVIATADADADGADDANKMDHEDMVVATDDNLDSTERTDDNEVENNDTPDETNQEERK